MYISVSLCTILQSGTNPTITVVKRVHEATPQA
jgi:hypothetical protein